MTKNEMIKKIQETISIDVPLKDIAEIVDAIPTVVVETLKNDKNEKITLNGLGAFKVKDVPERKGIIRMGERTGEEYVVPAHSEITFKMSKTAKML